MNVFGWVAACPTCAKNRLMGTQSKGFMRLFLATEPFAALAIDLVGLLPRTPEGYEYILVICDLFTKVTRAVSFRDITALDVLSAFLNTCVASYEIPDSSLSKSGPQFAAVLWPGVLKTLGFCWDSKLVPLSYSHNTGVNGPEEFKLIVQQYGH